MTTTTAFTTSASLDPARNEPFELGRVQWIRRFGEGGRPALACGYWHVDPTEAPEPFDLVMEADETIHIIEGHLRIEVEGGDVHELTAGGAEYTSSTSQKKPSGKAVWKTSCDDSNVSSLAL